MKPIAWKSTTATQQPQDQTATNEAVKKFLSAGIIEEMPTQSSKFLSKFFTIQEPNKRRPILDCQKINQFIQCEHFKMEGVPALRELIEKNDYMCKIDLKDAYTVVPIHPDSRKFLTFKNEGIIYQYRSLAFGLNVAPRVFSKLIKYAIAPLREQGIRLVYYLDDICLLSNSQEELISTTQLVIKHLKTLGFIINQEKSILTPSQTQEFLGFIFNSKKMKIIVPTLKINNLLQRMKQAAQPIQRSCRWIAGLLGKVTSMIPAIGKALLHVRHLQRDLARALHLNHQNWEKPCLISAQSQQEIQWWKESIVTKNGLPIQSISLVAPHITIYTDSSETGWGISSPMTKTFGFWNQEQQATSINVRELMAVYYALKIHAQKYKNCTIKVFTDNTTALKYTTKDGGTASFHLQDLAVKIQDLCNQFNLNVIYQHIQGIKNISADHLSRKKIPLYEQAIPLTMFKTIQQKWGPLKIDAFAAVHNHQLKRYWSLHLDPQAEAQDAMTQTWIKKGLYLHPPWKLIPRVIQKIKQQKIHQAVLVTPFWPSQFWFPMILKLKHLDYPIIMKSSTTKFYLAAWLLSTKQGESPISSMKRVLSL